MAFWVLWKGGGGTGLLMSGLPNLLLHANPVPSLKVKLSSVAWRSGFFALTHCPVITAMLFLPFSFQLPLRMRLRLAYTLPSGTVVQEIEEISSFPEAAWK